jgi:Co/Zn/Cd efflux system component
MRRDKVEETKMKKTIPLFNTLFISMFILSAFILFSIQYIFEKTPYSFISYIAITSLGLFLVINLVGYFTSIKKMDIDFFRDIIIGIAGGSAVWILSTTNLSSFKINFWLSINDLITKIGIVIILILISYIICKKPKPPRREER